MLMRRWLDAAGIIDPELRRCYSAVVPHWRALAKTHSWRRWGVWFPAALRPYLLAISTTILLADEHADSGDPATRLRRHDEFAEDVFAALAAGHSENPVLNATAHAFSVWGLRPSLLEELFEAQRRDAAFTPFATHEELLRWAHGSTSAGLILVWPLLGHSGSIEVAEPLLRRFGAAVQITDNLFDLAEDLQNGRLYLPLEDLKRFGVKQDDLFQGRWSTAVAELLAFEVARERVLDGLFAELQPLWYPGTHPFFHAWVTGCNLLLDSVLEAGASSLRHKPLLPIQRWFAAMLSEPPMVTLAPTDIPSPPKEHQGIAVALT